MKPDNVRRLVVEDFKQEDRELVTRLAETFNPFQEQIVNILDGNVQIDNLDRQLIEIKLQVDANGIPLQSTKFSAKVGMKGSNVLRVTNNSNIVKFVTGAPFMSFTPQGNGIYIVNHITGLIALDKYTIYVELVP